MLKYSMLNRLLQEHASKLKAWKTSFSPQERAFVAKLESGLQRLSAAKGAELEFALQKLSAAKGAGNSGWFM